MLQKYLPAGRLREETGRQQPMLSLQRSCPQIGREPRFAQSSHLPVPWVQLGPRIDQARAEVQELGLLHAALVESPIAGQYNWADKVESMRRDANAWVDLAED